MELDPAVLAALDGADAPATESTATEEAVAAPETALEAAPEAVPEQAPVETPKASLEAAKSLRDRAAREREFRAQEAAIKREKAELERYKAEVAEAQELIRLSKEDPLAWLEKTGNSFERMGTDLAMGKRSSPVDKVVNELNELKQRIAQREALEARMQVAEDYENIRSDITQFVQSKPDKYGYTAASGMHDLVLEAAQSHFEETGQIDLDGAAEQVERYLESIVEKAQKSEKFKSRSRSSATEPAPKTLTHKNSSQVTSRESTTMTEKERLANAIALL
jgi:hypothetical protein